MLVRLIGRQLNYSNSNRRSNNNNNNNTDNIKKRKNAAKKQKMRNVKNEKSQTVENWQKIKQLKVAKKKREWEKNCKAQFILQIKWIYLVFNCSEWEKERRAVYNSSL